MSEQQKTWKALEIKCNSCGASLKISIGCLARTRACEYCGTLNKKSASGAFDIAEAQTQLVKNKFFLMGHKGELQGTRFEVIGGMERTSDGHGWIEYLLFNPHEGFRWLVHDEGEFYFIETLKEVPEFGTSPDGSRTLSYHRQAFRKSFQGESRVTSVIGEFYWLVSVGERSYYTLFASKRDTEITEEVSPEELIYSFSQRVPFEQFLSGFLKDHLDAQTQAKIARGGQRHSSDKRLNIFTEKVMKAKRIAIAFTCIAVVTFITFIALSSRQAVVNWKLQHQPTPTGAAYELPIEVTKRNFGTSRWSLVTTLNERTSAYFQFLVEDDSGERVDSLKTQAHNPNSSKKSFRKTFYMERLPVGKYKVRLIIKDDAQVADFSNKPKYHLRINAETGSQGSFWLIIALVLFWLPVLYYAIRRDIHHNLAAHR